MKRLVLLGAGGHGKVVLDIAKLSGRYQQYVFLDDAHESIAECAGIAVEAPLHCYADYLDSETEFFVAMGSCAGRQQWLEILQGANANVATLIHPSAVVADSARVASGVLICAGAVVNPDTKIGFGVIVNTRASVDHDCVIGAFSHICPGVAIAGIVTIGARCWIGIGASIIQLVSIADDCIIGAGAAVIQSTNVEQTLVGVPARPISKG
ncbi:acetyltransferase [Neiella marina]|uniref:Acetyltransferase n=1 Tax=Neiella holothuriorum TaxID=2870530 RepID=A0ABS7EE68_9GAMM|nr:acetyltransferase [Neiella holothuriorum]MBW8190545.1 acetyltransferase [Neiella holothuriorum]